jgi:large subunit ribosomal protein L10
MTNLERNRKAKENVVLELSDRLSRAKSVVLVDARGLTAAQDTTLRQSLRKAGPGSIEYKVYKNSMIAIAIKDTPFAGIDPYLAGPTALAFSYDDATAAAAQINKHLKAMPKLEFKAGAIDGTIYDAEGMKAVAEIPPREVLLSRLLGSFKSPMSSFARVVKEIAEKKSESA